MKYLLFAASFLVGQVFCKTIIPIDERYVCNVKKSCFDCLRLPHCSWCGESSQCFSKNLPDMEDFCKDGVTEYVDHGRSLEDNARCTCFGDGSERNCYPPGVTDGLECFGRGNCECGRCVCDPIPDPNNATKKIMGEFCEFDNFSCDGPRCNEGPYHINQVYDNLDEV